MKVASALLTATAAALWLAWTMRDFHDNQRNWLMWLAMLTTALAGVSLMSLGLQRRRHHRR